MWITVAILEKKLLLHDGQGPKTPISGKKSRQEFKKIQKFIYTETEKHMYKLEMPSNSGLSAGSRVIIGLKVPLEWAPSLWALAH